MRSHARFGSSRRSPVIIICPAFPQTRLGTGLEDGVCGMGRFLSMSGFSTGSVAFLFTLSLVGWRRLHKDVRMSAATRIIGIDPGLRRCGWGVIETLGNRLT